MKFKNLLLLFFIAFSSIIYSQSTISGTIVDAKTLKPIPNATIIVEGVETVKSNSLGNFQIWNVPFGPHTIKATSASYTPYNLEIDLNTDYKYLRIRMGEATKIAGTTTSNTNSTTTAGTNSTVIHDTIVIEKVVYKNVDNPSEITASNSNDIPTIILEEDAKAASVNTAGILTASRDPFYNTASYTFGSYRFRLRGLDNNHEKLLINNIEMNDMGLGRPSWSQWGGLNDVLRNRTSVHGLEKSNFSFGGLNGSSNIDMRASSQRKQLKVSYAFSNRGYMHRAMATYSSGMMKGGWAISVSGSYRFADNSGEINDKIRFNQFGTTYQAFSWFAGIDKKFGENHLLSLNIFGANNKRGKNAATTQEAMDLAGSHYYNPNWGYQTEPDGKKYIRNAKTTNLYIPTAILMHDWKLKNNSSLKTSVAYRMGKNGGSTLDWVGNTSDPRPDYYRNMPSYTGLSVDDEAADRVTSLLKSNPNLLQLNWDEMYEANRMNIETVENPNGTNDTAQYNLAKYVVMDRRYDPTTFNFTSIYENILNENVTFNLGVNYAHQKTHNYQLVKDLLGAEYYLNINKFGQRDFPGNNDIAQFDLDAPNKLLKVGDKFGYDYNTNTTKKGLWAQTVINFNKIEFFVASEIKLTSLWREGLVRNGFFPNDSKGKSEVKKFTNFKMKGGITYKINGRNYLFANGAYGTRAPYMRNAMLSPRSRNDFIKNLQSETLYSVEGGYIFKAPKIKARLVAYAAWDENQVSNRGVYFDFERTFGAFIIDDINTRQWGFELATEIEAFAGFTISPVIAWGDHTYTSRPTASLIKDNDNSPVFEDRTLYYKGLHVANGPQAAYSLGLGYRTSSYWFFNVNFSYFDKIYINVSPDRRTIETLDGVKKDSDLWVSMLSQERRAGQFVMDASIGKSIRLKDKKDKAHYLNFNLNVGNITNNTDFVTGGYEQYRYVKSDGLKNRFHNKYYYAYGLNFYLGVSYRF